MNVQLLVFLFDIVFELCLCILITLITALRENLLYILRGHLVIHQFWIFAYLFNVVFMVIFYYNTPIYREILLQFIQFTEKYYANRTSFCFRRRAEAVLRCAARLSKAFSTARPSTPKKWFYTSIWAVLYEKVLAHLSTARRLK